MTDRPMIEPVPQQDDALDHRSGTLDPRTVVMLIACLWAVLLSAAVVLLPVRYAILRPGPVLNTLGERNGTPLIAISGRRTYETSGTLDLTTVSVLGGPDRKVTLLQVFDAWLRDSNAVLPEEAVFAPGETREESTAENAAEMVSSQESATAAALRALGITVPTTLTVAGTDPQAPAADTLKSGDTILGIDGRAVADLSELRTRLAAARPGEEVQVRVRRAGQVRTIPTATTQNSAGDTALGIYLTPEFDFPFEVKIQIEDIGGPSAGMMFALGIMDMLTEGDLTGGKDIAGTGTIDTEGTVGPIGGIRQKLVAARDAGAEYFLAPAENCDQVVDHVPDGLDVVRVETLEQARADVEAIAKGDVADLPRCG